MASISANEIKRVKSLQQKKFRDENGMFIVEGEKMVQEALSSPFAVEAVYLYLYALPLHQQQVWCDYQN